VGEVVAHEQRHLVSGFRVSVGEAIAKIYIRPMADDVAEARGGLDGQLDSANFSTIPC
jgi:hypothetical protein